MSVSWRARRRWALLVLLLGLPAYVVAAVTILGWFDRPGVALELLVYVGLGILWALPLRAMFLGIGRREAGSPSDRAEPPGRQ
jgi:hypothetical protein